MSINIRASTLQKIAEDMGEFEDVTGQKAPLEPPAKSGGKFKLSGGLTLSQDNFCKYVASGIPLGAAYRKAYPTATTKNQATIYQRSSRLYKKPGIKERIDGLLREREAYALNDFARIRQFVVERLQLEAIKDSNSGSARVRALELLGKIDKVKLFIEDKTEKKDEPQSSGDILAELQSRLTRLMGTQGTIDITPDNGDIKAIACDQEEDVLELGEDEQPEES